MSTLEKLIAQLCPDGVEYKPLGEIGIFFSGMSGVSNKWADQGNCRFIEYMNVYENARIDVTRLAFATVKSMNQTSLQKGDVLFTAASEVPEECAIAGEIEDEIGDGVFADDHLFGLRPKSNVGIANGYLKYAFQSPVFKTQITRYVRGVTRFYIAKQEFVKATIPLPPLPVQKEIVRMLDDMAGLIDALEEELAARKKQYEWYRDRLMIFGDDVERKPLGSFAEITRGGSLQKRDFTEAGIPCIHYGQIYTRFGVWTDKPLTYTSSEKVPGQKFASVGDIVMAVTSETVEDVCKCVAWIGDAPAAVSGHTAIIHHNQNPKFLSYYFHTSQFATQKRHLAHGVKVIEVTPERLKNVIIPFPAMSEQNKIVRKLDDMTALIDGIEEEIALRKQQYELYRDKLLIFKKAVRK